MILDWSGVPWYGLGFVLVSPSAESAIRPVTPECRTFRVAPEPRAFEVSKEYGR